jgi:hypothetical protein
VSIGFDPFMAGAVIGGVGGYFGANWVINSMNEAP